MYFKDNPYQYLNIFRKYILFSFLLLAGVFLWSCQREEVINQLQREPYFDLKGLMNQQIAMLDSLDPSVRIKARIKGEEENITTHKDSSAWQASLKLFNDADINQPVLQGSYVVKDSFDRDKGLKLRYYEAREGTDTSIPYLKVYYQDTIANVRRIETIFQESNMLYSTQRKMSADFDNMDGKLRIIQFEANGRQKMLFNDSILFDLQADIEYDS